MLKIIEKLKEKFGFKRKDSPNQREKDQYCNDNNKNLKEILEELFDEYYKNKYEKWCKIHEDFLIKLKFALANAASKGLCHYEFVFISKEETNDKYHFEEWLEENDLEYDYELYNHQLEENDVINQYSFKIRWK